MSQAAESSEFVEASPRNVDRRDGVRVTIEAEVEITNVAKFLGTATDLSVGGVYIETHEELDVGTEVDLEMWVAEAREYVALPGEIRWCETKGVADGERGYGIEFVTVSAENREQLEKIVEKCRP